MGVALKINLPPKSGSDISAVYKIVFDNGMFYIGSSTMVHNRASSWASLLSGRTKNPKNEMKRMRAKICDCISATFSIFEIIISGLREAEYKYIKENENNPLLLNTFSFHSKPVIEYNLNGDEVARYISASSIAKAKGIKQSRIREVLIGDKKHYRGVVYKYTNPSDIPKKFYSRKYIKKPKVIKVHRYKKTGEYIDSFQSTTAAAKACGIDRRSIYGVMVGEQKTAGGFIWERANK